MSKITVPSVEQWYVVIDKTTGQIVSEGSVLGDPIELASRGLEAIALPQRFDPLTQVWDEKKRTIAPRPSTPDPISELFADPSITAALGKISALEREAMQAKMRTAVNKLVGDRVQTPGTPSNPPNVPGGKP